MEWISQTLRIDPSCWPQYATREETRREHLLELRAYLDLASFGAGHYRQTVNRLCELAMQTDKGVVLARQVLDDLRQRRIIIPSLDVIERVCAEAITRANRRLYRLLNDPLTTDHRDHLDELLQRKPDTKKTWLAWLRQSPGRRNSRQMLEHIERLRRLQALDLPPGIERQVHQNRLLKIAREGGQMTAADLAKFEPQRRYATLVALVTEATATVIDEIVNLHDQIIGRLFNRAKHKHQQEFQESGRAINDKLRLYGKIGRVLLEARESGTDAFAAIESVIPWEAFIASVVEAQKLAQSDDFDFLPRIGEGYHVLRRYSREFLTVLKLRAAPAGQDVLAAVEYPRQNGLAVALRELGRIERTLFILDWLQSVELRRRVNAGLNKGEARNALARAVFFYRLGELRDRSFEQQRYRASGLNLVTAAIVLWNTVYLERVARALRRRDPAWDERLLRYLPPLGWEHIDLTGDYVWRQNRTRAPGKFRPLRVAPRA